MSLEQGIMGFLSMRPLSGYDIKKLFDMSAAYFWPANQSQIYRTLKQLCKDGLVELKEQKKGETVDRKVYAITENGRREYLMQIQQNTVADFISRDSFLMQLYFAGALDRDEQVRLLDTQLQNINTLEHKLINLYNEKLEQFLALSGLTQDDPRFRSAMWAYDWELIKYKSYAKLLKTIKKDLQSIRTDEQE